MAVCVPPLAAVPVAVVRLTATYFSAQLTVITQLICAPATLVQVKAAVAEGIVPGGGVTLVDLSKKLTVSATTVSGSHDAGQLILKNALVQPFLQLMQNAGLNADAKLEKVLEAGEKAGFGFDVNNSDKLVNLKEKGILDPAKVTREAITNAVSVAGTAMTMGSLIVDLPEEKGAAGGGGGMPGGMGGMGMGDY